jgi:hypothetical protein
MAAPSIDQFDQLIYQQVFCHCGKTASPYKDPQIVTADQFSPTLQISTA